MDIMLFYVCGIYVCEKKMLTRIHIFYENILLMLLLHNYLTL